MFVMHTANTDPVLLCASHHRRTYTDLAVNDRHVPALIELTLHVCAHVGKGYLSAALGVDRPLTDENLQPARGRHAGVIWYTRSGQGRKCTLTSRPEWVCFQWQGCH